MFLYLHKFSLNNWIVSSIVKGILELYSTLYKITTEERGVKQFY